MVCRYCENEICVNDLCPMCADYCPVPDTEGVCRFEFREEVHKLTPKGCFKAALVGYLEVDDFVLDELFDKFYGLMLKNGYIENSEDV